MDVRRWVAAGVLVPLLGLAGCDGDSQADPQDPTTSAAPSPSPTATETETETESAPTIPPEAMGTDEASAKAFVRFYFGLLTTAMRTGETRQLDTLSQPTCGSCKSLSKNFRDVYKAGGRFETKGWNVERIVQGETVGGSVRDYFLRVRQAPRSLFNKDGKLVDSQPVASTGMHIVLEPRAESWQVRELEVVR